MCVLRACSRRRREKPPDTCPSVPLLPGGWQSWTGRRGLGRPRPADLLGLRDACSPVREFRRHRPTPHLQMFPLKNSLRVNSGVCSRVPRGSGQWRGAVSPRGGCLRFRRCRGFERVVHSDASSQQGVLRSVPSPSPGASLFSCILLIVKHAERRQECGGFTRPHTLSTDSGSARPSWNHVPWRDSQMGPGAPRTGRVADRVAARGCVVLHGACPLRQAHWTVLGQ